MNEFVVQVQHQHNEPARKNQKESGSEQGKECSRVTTTQPERHNVGRRFLPRAERELRRKACGGVRKSFR
jgi:hypothetical protein